VGIYPVGSLVRLGSGRLAVVTAQNPQSLLAPRVKAFFSTKSNMRILPQEANLASKLSNDKIVGFESPISGNSRTWMNSGARRSVPASLVQFLRHRLHGPRSTTQRRGEEIRKALMTSRCQEATKLRSALACSSVRLLNRRLTRNPSSLRLNTLCATDTAVSMQSV
jgi:hypothetical protein